MKYFIKNGSEVDLLEKDFIAAGGFGKVYKKQSFAYKIYDKPSDMLPVGKIQELSVLNHVDIIKPENLIYDKSKKNIVGYTMRYVSGMPICHLFTSTFKKNNKITHKMCLDLLFNFYEKVEFVHGKNILIVDLNELNFLVNQNFDNIFFIDTDGYQTPSYNATGIMDNIRDRHCNNIFSQEVDWFSWGILATQILLGIHPYRGGHPDFDAIEAKERLNLRMMKNISIFNSKARLPNFCPPIESVIPSGLKQWMVAVFEQGKRIKPPKDFDSLLIVAKPNVQSFKGTNLLDINLIKTYNQEILNYYQYEGDVYVKHPDFILFNDKKLEYPKMPKNSTFEISYSKEVGNPYLFYIDENDYIKCFDLIHQKYIDSNFICSNLFRVGNRVYCIQNSKIYEIRTAKIGKNVYFESKVVGNALDLKNATKTYDGCLVQNALGKYIFSFLPKSETCYQMSFKELEGFQILDVKYENHLLMVCAIDKSGVKSNFIIKISQDFQKYSCTIKKNVQEMSLNFTVNDNGIVVYINEDEKIEIFSNNYTSNSVKILDDSKISSDMILTNNGSKILFYPLGEKSIYSISERK